MDNRLRSRAGQRWPKFPKRVFFVTSPLENLPLKPKIVFFSILCTRLAKSVEGLNSSLALAAGDLRPKKGWPIAVVKGSKSGPVPEVLSNLQFGTNPNSTKFTLGRIQSNQVQSNAHL